MLQTPFIWITFLVIMNLIWAGSNATVKYSLGFTDPLNLVFWRYFFAIVILILWIVIKRYKFKFNKSDVFRIILAGFCTGLTQVMWVFGINLSQATDSSILYIFEPVWGIILASIFLKEKMLRTTVVGAIIAIFGLGYLSNINFSSFTASSNSIALGNIIIVLSLIAEGFFSIIIKPVAKKQNPQVVITGVLISAILVVSIPLIFKSGLKLPTTKFVFPIFYLSILCSVIGYTLWVAIMKHVPVSIMLFTIFVQPISGPIIAAVFLGEVITSRIVYGGTILLIGTFIAILGHVIYSKKTDLRKNAVISTNPASPAV